MHHSICMCVWERSMATSCFCSNYYCFVFQSKSTKVWILPCNTYTFWCIFINSFWQRVAHIKGNNYISWKTTVPRTIFELWMSINNSIHFEFIVLAIARINDDMDKLWSIMFLNFLSVRQSSGTIKYSLLHMPFFCLNLSKTSSLLWRNDALKDDFKCTGILFKCTIQYNKKYKLSKLRSTLQQAIGLPFTY